MLNALVMATGDHDVDLVVIGAGPGGGSAALHAARSGLRVCVMEADPEVGTPVHCGECLSHLATEQLELDLPEDVIALTVQGVRVIFPDGTAKLLTEPGYVLEKHLFERWIIDQAVAQGATLHLGHRVTSMTREFDDDGTFTGWNLDGRGEVFPLRCRGVIDASGVHGAASRMLEMSGDVDVIAGFQYELHDVPNDGYLDFYIQPEYAPHGYVWMIPKAGGRANVGLVTTDKKGAVRYLDNFIQDTYLRGKPHVNPPWRQDGVKVRPFGGTIPISGPRPTTVGDGLLLVGDAAGFTSPLFEGGTHLALWSGRAAAETFAEALSHGGATEARLSNYERRWKAAFPPYHKILKGKTALYDLSDEEMSAMARCLPEELGAMSPLQKLTIGLKILVRRPMLFGKRVISVLLSFGYSRAKHFGW